MLDGTKRILLQFWFLIFSWDGRLSDGLSPLCGRVLMINKLSVTCKSASTLPIESLTELQGNLAEMSKENYEKLKNAFQKYGITFALTVWKNKGKNYIIDGTGRFRTLQKMKEEGFDIPPLPVVETVCKDMAEAKRKILLGRSEFHKTTEEGLYEFLNSAEISIDDMESENTFAGINFDRFRAGYGAEESTAEIPDVQYEKASELVKSYGIKKGQLWALGGHKIYCGDCRDIPALKKMFGKEKAVLLNTDPPYGIAYDSRASKPDGHKRKVAWEMVENDDKINEDIQPFLEECFKAMKENCLKENAAWYLWHAHLTGAFFAAAAAAAAADVLLHRQIIWRKPRFIIGRGLYHWSHEPCFMGWVRSNKPPFYGERNQMTVWDIDYDGKKNMPFVDRIHPTQKPVEIFAIPLRNHTKPNEICMEPFSGSGSQIIAAERLGRRCFACEIEPKYVAVAIQRWMDMAGKKPKQL